MNYRQLISMMAAGSSGGGSPADEFLIDEVGQAATAAYGLRKLRAAYGGSAVRVRRVSDDAEQDIGFDGENLDWASAISFKGGSSLTVKTWYDQSGNGYNATQSTNANQPSLDTTNFQVTFDGTNDTLLASSVNLSGTNKVSFFLLSKSSTVPGGGSEATHFQHGAPGAGVDYFNVSQNSSNQLRVQHDFNSSVSNSDLYSGYAHGFYRMLSAIIDRSLGTAALQTKGRINRAPMTDSGSGVPSGNFENANLAIGADLSAGSLFNGSMKELVVFPIALSDGERDAGEVSIQDFHNSGFDFNAADFIAQAGISDGTQKSAIDALVISLKTNSLWSKCDAIYPMVGGTSTTHKFNLKDPRDLDAAYRAVFNGTGTHDANGYTPNGTTGYADTKYNGSTAGRNDNSHMSVYVGTNTAAGDKTEISAYNGASAYWAIKCRDTGDITFHGMYRFTTDGFISVASNSDARGFYINSRRGATDGEAYKNGSSVGTDSTNSAQDIPNANVHIGKRSDSGASFTDRRIQFASVGQALTDTEAANLTTAVETFQDTLSRGVI